MTDAARGVGRSGAGLRRTGPLLAVVLVALVDAVVLAGAAWNRRGEPEASLTLTEREVAIAFTWKENSGIWLQLDAPSWGRWYAGDLDDSDRDPWDTPEKLKELGFDLRVPPGEEFAQTFYEKARTLERYAVLEYDGDAWKRWLERREREVEEIAAKVSRNEKDRYELERAQEFLEHARISRSRLMLVDVGRDAADLRRRHPDRERCLVVRAVMGIVLRGDWNEKTRKRDDASLHLSIQELLSSEIHVPRPSRPILEAIRRDDRAKSDNPYGYTSRPGDEPPRYEVSLVYGRRLEPWIAGVRRLEAAPRRSQEQATPRK